jgi:menaquinone-specific isochorismate synthase
VNRQRLDPSPAHARHLVSRTRRISHEDALDVLEAHEGQARCYWAEPELVHVGIGEAARLEPSGPGPRWDAIRSQAHDLMANATVTRESDVPADLGPRFLGGVAFSDSHRAEGRWSAFGPALFILPRRQLLWQHGHAYETLNEMTPGESATKTAFSAKARDPGAGQLSSGAWADAVENVTQRIRQGDLTKCVLARIERRPTRHHLAHVIRRLAAHPDETYRFLFEPSPGHAFYGSTPELLAHLRGRRVATVALAGSAARGEDASQNNLQGRRLLPNPKDALEHELVVSFLREQLTGARATDIRQSPRRLRRLQHIQHLETRLEARLEDGARILDIVQRLHPTPAVGGLPRDAALNLIARLEPFARGWYAGAVGWFDAQENGTFAVAIRSALTTPEATWLFAGAGIVAGSEPQAEWDETTMKMRLMDEAVTETPDP